MNKQHHDREPYRLGDKCIKETANRVRRTGRAVYIHPDKRYYVLEFVTKFGKYREAFKYKGKGAPNV